MATYILSVVLQISLLLLVGLAASRFFLRHAPVRHSILFGTLLCVTLSPLLLWACTKLNLTSAELRIPAALSDVPSSRVVTERPVRIEPHPAQLTAAESESSQSPLSGAADSPPSAARSNWLALAIPCGIGVWLAGAMALSWGIVRSWWKLRMVRRDVLPIASAELEAVAVEVRRALNVRVLPPVVESRQVSGPIAAGLRRPLIILPAGLCGHLTRPQLRDVLIHEAAHIVRHDNLVVLLQAAARVVLWPHPLIHLLNRELAAAREDICDNFVLGHSDTVSFAETLLELAHRVKASPAMPATAGLFPVRGKLETRVTSLLDERRSTQMRLSRTTSVIVALSILAVAVASGTARVALSGDATAAGSPTDAVVETIRSEDVGSLPPPDLMAKGEELELPPAAPAADSLGAADSPAAPQDRTVSAEQLVEQMRDARQRDDAIAALQALGPPAELDVLSALHSADRATRMAAYQVLEGIGTQSSLDFVEQQYLQRSGLEQSAAKTALDAIWRRLGGSTVEQRPSARSIRLFE